MTAVRVVVAEDDASLRNLLRIALELDGGCTVVGQTEEGGAVLDLVAAERPDVVVLDMQLPVATGEQVLDGLLRNRRARGGPAIVGFSAEPERLHAAAKAGVDATVCKDEPLDRLLDAVRRVDAVRRASA
jgi:two-component system response regulator DesR